MRPASISGSSEQFVGGFEYNSSSGGTLARRWNAAGVRLGVALGSMDGVGRSWWSVGAMGGAGVVYMVIK